MDRLGKFNLSISALDNIPADIAIFDRAHRYLYLNKIAIQNEELRHFIIGKTDQEYFEYRGWDPAPAIMRHQKFELSISSRSEITWDEKVKRNGKDVIVSRRFFPVFENDELLYVIGYGIDITNMKNFEYQKDKLLLQLSERNNKMAELIEVMSHNIKGPLVTIEMLIKNIVERHGDTEDGKLLAEILPTMNDLLNHVNVLVDSVYYTASGISDMQLMSIGDLLTSVLEKLKSEILIHDITISTRITGVPYVFCSEVLLGNVLYNLISNAIKFRSAERNPVILISTAKEGNNTYITIEDNGIGIDLKKNGRKLFKMGQGLHPGISGKAFGLFLAWTQLESIGASITIESEKQLFTRVTIKLPNVYESDN